MWRRSARPTRASPVPSARSRPRTSTRSTWARRSSMPKRLGPPRSLACEGELCLAVVAKRWRRPGRGSREQAFAQRCRPDAPGVESECAAPRNRGRMAEEIIGRREELLALGEFVEAVPAGGAALLFEGDAGIG